MVLQEAERDIVKWSALPWVKVKLWPFVKAIMNLRVK
jgi:hypothetical protein